MGGDSEGSCSPLFAGKTCQATNHLVPLAVDPVALLLLAYRRASKIGFAATQPCFQDRPLARETGQTPTPLRRPHGAHHQRKAEHLYVYARSCQECRQLGFSPSEWDNAHYKCVCSVSQMGTSCPTHTQIGATLCRQFQEAHGSTT